MSDWCAECCGNGEIVTDWERYLAPRRSDVGDEAVAECPGCDGQGYLPNETQAEHDPAQERDV